MIYIHVPFCHRKCTYCAFFSKAESGKWKVERYVDALLDEMRQRKGEQAHPVRTVYFGGGTPSILPLEQLGRIVGSLRECFDLSQVEEVTLEANPEDLSPEYLRGLKDMGFVNRLSIGIQSLDDEMLRLIGRRHTARQAVEAVENAYNAGFHNISVDFIYGLPSSLITHPSSLITYNSSLITHHSSLITHHSSLIEDDYTKIVPWCAEHTPQGGVVLLSPAAASYDAFKNFEHRGDFYSEQIMKLNI